MAIKLADLIENVNSNYPVIDADASGASGIKGFGIFNGFGVGAGQRGSLPANKQCTGYIAVDSATGKVEVYTGGDWTTSANWKPVLDLSNLPDPDLTTNTAEFTSASELLFKGRNNGTEGAHLVAYTDYENQEQQFKFDINDIAGALLFTMLQANVDNGSAPNLDSYVGDNTTVIGDFNGDGYVDFADLTGFLGLFGNSNAFPLPTTLKVNLGPLRDQGNYSYITNGLTYDADSVMIDLSSTNTSYTAGSKWYLPLNTNVGGANSITYYVVTAGSAAHTIGTSNLVDGTAYFEVGDSASGAYEIGTLYTGSFPDFINAVQSIGPRILQKWNRQNNNASNVPQPLGLIHCEGPESDTVKFGVEVKMTNAGGTGLEYTFGTELVLDLEFEIEALGGASTIISNAYSTFLVSPNQAEQLQILQEGNTLTDGTLVLAGMHIIDSNSAFDSADLPITKMTFRPYIISENGTSKIEFSDLHAFEFKFASGNS